MTKLKNMDGFHTYGWMVNKLGLEGSDLTAFALIYGFVKDYAGEYLGNTAYLSLWTGWSDRTSRVHLASLVERGFIVETEGRDGNNPLRRYKLAPGFYEKYSVKFSESKSEKTSELLGKNFREEENKNRIYINNSTTPHTPHDFDFRAALVALGVSTKVADDWLKVRKTKKATNTQTAFEAIAAEIAKSGRTADECIRFAVTQSWAGFRADWLQNAEAPRSSNPTPSPRPAKKKDSFDHMMEVGRELGIIKDREYDEQ